MPTDPIRAVGCWPTDPDATIPKRERVRPLTLDEMLAGIPTSEEMLGELMRRNEEAELRQDR